MLKLLSLPQNSNWFHSQTSLLIMNGIQTYDIFWNIQKTTEKPTLKIKSNRELHIVGD